ncbi:MAG TPA: TetR/AcrR family transcriptional regulator [Dehalococcoidia bacterium]|nr:TetR/AcrR family transcriptional regulator [Dehalococcoidia bacterium]
MSRVTEAHIEARREQIVNAAWACFARKGYHQTTMQDIATEADLSAGAIYRYYASKEAVLKAINDRSQETGRALVQWARSQAEGPIGILGIIGRTIFSLFNDPGFETATRVNIEIWPEIIRDEELVKGIRTEMRFWLTVVTELLREARARGEIQTDADPEGVAALLICSWEGLRHYGLIDRDSFNAERHIETVGRLLQAEMLTTLSEIAGLQGIQVPSLGLPLGMGPGPAGGRDEKEA